MKKHYYLLLVLFALFEVAPAWADAVDGIKDRNYYIAQNDNVNYPNAPETPMAFRIGGSPWLSLGNFCPNTGWGFVFTILAVLPESERVAQGCDGYMVVGSSKDFTKNRVSSTSATVGSFGMKSQYWNESDPFVRIPKYITPTTDNRNTSYLQSNDTYDNLKFKIVGIDYAAFASTSSFSLPCQIILPNSVTYIGVNALYFAGNATNQASCLGFWDGENVNTVVRTNESSDWQTYNNIEYIGFQGCQLCRFPSMESVVVPGKVKKMDYKCFDQSPNITSIDLTPYTAWNKVIPYRAFSKCTALTTANLANTININNAAFWHCTALRDVYFPATVSTLSDSAFAECFSLNDPHFDSGITNLTEIGYRAFFDCSSLSLCTLPTSVTKLNDQAFSYCDFTGRFFIPKHIKEIGSRCYYANDISYIPISTAQNVNDGGLIIHDLAFRPKTNGSNLTVEFADAMPPNITTDGTPFQIPGKDTNFSDVASKNRLRLIVPKGSGERYVHNQAPNNATAIYAHHDYRVRFNFSKSYTLPNYGEPGNTVTAPWYIASSAWDNDFYNFKPNHGGSVDYLTITSSTDQMGQAGDLVTVETDYVIDEKYGNVYARTDPGVWVQNGNPNVMPRTAHKYHDNEDVDDIARIATLEVEDGIAPFGSGFLFSYKTPGIYLAPLYANWGTIAQVTGVKASKYKATLNNPGQMQDNPDMARLKFETTDLAEESLSSITTWVDLRERKSKKRELRVYSYDTNGNLSFSLQAYDLMTENIDFNEEVTYTDANNNTVSHKKYVYYTANTTDENGIAPTLANRCGVYYKRYKVPSNINWTEIYENRDLLWDVLILDGEVLVKPNWDNSTTGESSAANLGITISGTNRYWVDLTQLQPDMSYESVEVSEAFTNFRDNHTDRGNVLVPCIDRRWVYPYWKVIDEATYNSLLAEDPNRTDLDIATYHYHDANGVLQTIDEYVQGKTEVELTPEGNYGEGFISFGLSNGYFVQASVANRTQADRAYFRVHTSVLHSSAHKPTGSSTRMRAVIVDENEDFSDVLTGIGSATVSSSDDNAAWYTLDGRCLGARPTTKGVYIRDGKKFILN